MTNVITCVSGPGLIKAKEQIEGKPLGEMRLDLLNISIEEVRILWKMADNWVLTLREKFTKKETWKEEFENCLALNPVLVDVDSELPNTVKLEAINMVKKSNHELMLSYHNFQETPSFESLNLTVKSLFDSGADVVKLACLANKEEDNLTLMDLYREHTRLVAFCMGEHGKESRITSLFFGEKLTYAAPSAYEIVAPGQFTYNELYELLNLGFDE